jgi:hypothetical protein
MKMSDNIVLSSICNVRIHCALGDEVYEQVTKFNMFSAAEAVREMWILEKLMGIFCGSLQLYNTW